MFYFIKFLESLLLPPGIFIILLLVLSIIIVRKHRVIAAIISVITLLAYAASTAVVAYALIQPLEAWYIPPAQPHGDVLVMLGGGSTFGTPAPNGLGNLTGDGANRLLTTAMLHQQTGLPILLTSGPMRDGSSQSLIAKQELIELGVPKNKIFTENNSLNTRQNAEDSKPILHSKGFTHPILITSAYHMRRSVLDFKRIGLSVTPYPCGYYADKGTGLHDDSLLPSAAALATTETALHEYLGILATMLGIGR